MNRPFWCFTGRHHVQRTIPRGNRKPACQGCIDKIAAKEPSTLSCEPVRTLPSRLFRVLDR